MVEQHIVETESCTLLFIALALDAILQELFKIILNSSHHCCPKDQMARRKLSDYDRLRIARNIKTEMFGKTVGRPLD